MRVTNFLMHDLALKALQNKQAEVFRTQQQVATGKRLLSPSDSPTESARLVELRMLASYSEQVTKSNATSAGNTLKVTDVVLTRVEALINEVTETALTARGAGNNESLNNSLAADLVMKLDELISLANEKDGQGQNLFSGLSGVATPFARVPVGDPDFPVKYFGNQEQRFIKISQTLNVPVSDSGTDVFERIKNGNGVVVATAGALNTGNGVISPTSIANQADPNIRETVTITFDNPPTTFSVAGAGTGNPAGVPFTSGAPITFNGWNLAITGTPAAGDTFTVQASTSKDIFSTIQDLIDELKLPVQTGNDQARRANAVNGIVANLKNASDHMVKIHTGVSSRLSTVESVVSYGKELTLQYQGMIAQIEEVDYNQAISDLNVQKVQLEAAQRSFVLIRDMSLFNFL